MAVVNIGGQQVELGNVDPATLFMWQQAGLIPGTSTADLNLAIGQGVAPGMGGGQFINNGQGSPNESRRRSLQPEQPVPAGQHLNALDPNMIGSGNTSQMAAPPPGMGGGGNVNPIPSNQNPGWLRSMLPQGLPEPIMRSMGSNVVTPPPGGSRGRSGGVNPEFYNGSPLSGSNNPAFNSLMGGGAGGRNPQPEPVLAQLPAGQQTMDLTAYYGPGGAYSQSPSTQPGNQLNMNPQGGPNNFGYGGSGLDPTLNKAATTYQGNPNDYAGNYESYYGKKFDPVALGYTPMPGNPGHYTTPSGASFNMPGAQPLNPQAFQQAMQQGQGGDYVSAQQRNKLPSFSGNPTTEAAYANYYGGGQQPPQQQQPAPSPFPPAPPAPVDPRGGMPQVDWNGQPINSYGPGSRTGNNQQIDVYGQQFNVPRRGGAQMPNPFMGGGPASRTSGGGGYNAYDPRVPQGNFGPNSGGGFPMLGMGQAGGWTPAGPPNASALRDIAANQQWMQSQGYGGGGLPPFYYERENDRPNMAAVMPPGWNQLNPGGVQQQQDPYAAIAAMFGQYGGGGFGGGGGQQFRNLGPYPGGVGAPPGYFDQSGGGSGMQRSTALTSEQAARFGIQPGNPNFAGNQNYPGYYIPPGVDDYVQRIQMLMGGGQYQNTGGARQDYLPNQNDRNQNYSGYTPPGSGDYVQRGADGRAMGPQQSYGDHEDYGGFNGGFGGGQQSIASMFGGGSAQQPNPTAPAFNANDPWANVQNRPSAWNNSWDLYGGSGGGGQQATNQNSWQNWGGR